MADAIFQCNIFQHNLFQVGVACRAGGVVTPPMSGDPGGYAGSDSDSRKRAEEHAALRAIAERAARRAELQRVAVVAAEAARAIEAKPVTPAMQPVLMDFGAGKVTLGIHAPTLAEQLHNEILADDEEAIIAILLAAI